MADNFEQLGFQVKVDGADSAVSNLDRIVERLEKIQKLQGKSIGKGSTSSKSGSPTSSKLTDEERWDKQYQDKMRKQAYYLKQGYVQQKNIISDHTKWVLAEEKKLEKKRFLIEQGYITPKAPKVSLTDEEKYTQRVARSTQLLNSAKYKELRRTELANQQRKKEIDQRLKQELGIKQTTNALTAYIGKLTAVAVIARKLGRFISSAIQESANYVENLNLFAVAYGDVYQETLGWALDLADGFGLASNEVLKFAGTFRQLSTSLGLVEDTANSVSQTVTQLGYDISALFNTSVENAMEKLQSGLFSGNARPLRAYGIDISQNQIDALFETNQELASLGVNARNLSQSDKVLARLIITLRDGSNAFGTMNREINTLQSQIRILQGSFSNFKLAIGDLVQEPIRITLIYINAFIIAVTKVIRAIHPLKTEDENAFMGVAMGAEEANEAVEELNGRLTEFDKFNVLGGKSSSSNNIAVTEALTAELEKQQKLYKEQIDLYSGDIPSSMGKTINSAVQLAEKIVNLIAVFDEEGNFVDWAGGIKLVANALGVLLTYRLTGWAGSLISSIAKATKTIGAFSLATNLLVSGGLYLLIKNIVDLIVNSDKLSASGKIVRGIFAAIGAALALAGVGFKVASLQSKKFGVQLNSAIAPALLLGAAIAGVGALTLNLISNWKDMSNFERAINIIGILAGAMLGLAAAMAIAHGSWSGLTGAMAIIGTIGLITAAFVSFKNKAKEISSPIGFAEGGYTNANFIMTHENGKREWVGKAAGSSAIVNDTQMSDIMEVAVAKGVVLGNKALASQENGSGGAVIHNHIYMDGKQIYEGVTSVAKQYGNKWDKY